MWTNTSKAGGGDNAVPAPSQDVQVAPDFVLNGAQIQAALEIVQQVIAQQIPRDTAIGLLKVGFNMSDAQAAQVLGSAGIGFIPAAQDEATE